MRTTNTASLLKAATAGTITWVHQLTWCCSNGVGSSCMCDTQHRAHSGRMRGPHTVSMHTTQPNPVQPNPHPVSPSVSPGCAPSS